MGFPIVNGKEVLQNPPGDQVQFVTFTGNSVVTAVISTTEGAVEVRFVEADAQGKAPKSPEEFLSLKPRVVLKFPHLASFDRFVETLQGSQGTMQKAADEAEAKKNGPGGTTKRKLFGFGQPKRSHPADQAAPVSAAPKEQLPKQGAHKSEGDPST